MDCLNCLMLLWIASTAYSLPQGQYGAPPAVQQFDQKNAGYEGGMPYSFDWSVNDAESGNNFGHKEESNGNAVQGAYYVLLPDGRIQTVTYNVDGDSGFVANVKYEGEPTFPDSQKSQGYN